MDFLDVRRRMGRLVRQPPAPTVQPPGHPAWEPAEVTIGRHSHGSLDVRSYPGYRGKVVIGSFSSIADGVTFLPGGEHRTDWVTTFALRARLEIPGAFEDGIPYGRGPITVGNDVWVGFGATIMSGVTIGDGAVVGAKALVTADVRPYAIVGGVPARERRRRFTDEQVDALLRIAWWDWPDEDVRRAADALSCDDIDAFIRQFG